MSSQRTGSCQGPLQTDALPVLAKALREQFEFGLGAHLLSGVRRYCKARPIASRRGEAVVFRASHITVIDASAHAGAGTLGCRGARPICATVDVLPHPVPPGAGKRGYG